MVDNKIKLSKLLSSIFTISILGFGGGAAVIPLFHKEFIEKNKWLDDSEFQDILSVSNALPGPIQTKLAGYLGFRLKGYLGLILSLLTIILPSLLIMLIFYQTIVFYKDVLWVKSAIYHVYPVVTIMMLLLTYTFFNKSRTSIKQLNFFILLIISLVGITILNLNPALVILFILISVFIPKLSDYKRFSLMALFILITYLSTILNQSIGLSSIQTYFSNVFTQSSDLVKLSIAFLLPGILGYGGGPGSLSLISFEVVDQFQLVTSDQFALLTAIQGALPGVTATKLAGTIGFQTSSFLGSLISIISYVLPSMILMISLMNLLEKYKNTDVVKRLKSYINPVVVVLLGNLTFTFFMQAINSLVLLEGIIMLIASAILLIKFKIHPFIAIIIFMTFGAVYSLI